MIKKALITGITGQDGSYLAEFLLKKNYKVHGLVRRVASEDSNHRHWRLRHILDKIVLHPASLESYASMAKIIQKVKPNEVYHLGAELNLRRKAVNLKARKRLPRGHFQGHGKAPSVRWDHWPWHYTHSVHSPKPSLR